MWFDTEDIPRLGQSLEGLPILNNYTTVITAISHRGEIGEILGDHIIYPYDSFLDIEQCKKK